MKAEFAIIDQTGPFVAFTVTYDEPSLKKNGQPLDDLKEVQIWSSYLNYAPYATIIFGASTPAGGQTMTTSNNINIPPGEKTTVKFWGIAINLAGQESDRSDTQEIVVDRTLPDPQLAPMPPQ